MSRTLADVTPAERAACVGMWCEISGRHLAVLADIWEHGEGGVVHSNADLSCYDFAELAPRFDLPRAWTPEGEPVAGEWEYAVGHVVEYADGQKECRPKYREDARQSALKSAEELKDDGYVAMSRYVADWEEA